MSGIPESIRILLIDDDEDEYVKVRDLLTELPTLTDIRRKFPVTWKASYEEGLAELKSGKHDVCLLDYRLGMRTGLDLIREAGDIVRDCPMILLTGHGDPEIDMEALKVGAADFLVKGQLTPPLLDRTIRYTLKHAQDVKSLSQQIEQRKQLEAQVIQQDRLASLGLLASSLAHEIGTPMAVVRGRAEMMAEHADEAVRKNVDVITSQIDRISVLIRSLLQLARGGPAENLVPVDVSAVVGDIARLMSHELERNKIGLGIDVRGTPFVNADSGPLGQVLLNLIVNSVHAIKVAQNGGRTEDHRITLRTENRGDQLEIILQDTGCGIPEKNIPQLFKPFFTTKAIGSGTGLGLAISYKLVQSWSGSIRVQSTLNEGTSFSLLLGKTDLKRPPAPRNLG